MKKVEIEKYLFGIYCAGIIIQNILATKNIDITIFTVTTGILVSPLVFIIQDIQTEIFGYKKAKKMIILGYLMNFIAIMLYTFSISIPSSSTYTNQEAFTTILGTTPRIAIASFIAYMIGALINSKVMEKLKNKHEKNLFFRAISSTVVGQFIDNMLFAVIAFIGILPTQAIISMIVGGTLFEIIYEIIFYPITKKLIQKIKVSK
nr:MAG TPA: Putative vitamin uptake transporter [Caudoviricetes sp.]